MAAKNNFFLNKASEVSISTNIDLLITNLLIFSRLDSGRNGGNFKIASKFETWLMTDDWRCSRGQSPLISHAWAVTGERWAVTLDVTGALLVCLTGIVPLDCSSYEKRVSVLVCSCWWNLETPTMCGCWSFHNVCCHKVTKYFWLNLPFVFFLWF